MKRVAPLFVSMMLVPVLAGAQTPVLPTPPAAPAPAAAPVPPQAPPPTRRPAPTPPTPPAVYIDRMAIEDAREAAQLARIDAEAVRESARIAADQARAVADMTHVYDYRFDQMSTVFSSNGPQSSESSSYSSGLNLMFDKQFEQAITRFDRVINQKGAHADAAMYHKAYCQARLGQSNEAAATIAELKKSYPNSAYLKDARALEVDVKKLGPNEVDDEDLKIAAIQTLMYQNPDQAIPLLEGVLTKSTNSLKYKRQALFVLAQIDQPRARQVLLGYAKGSGNPDLQKRAIELLGSRGQKTSAQELIDIYNSTQDFDVRMSVITAFRSAGAKTPLLSIAGNGHLGQTAPVVVNASDLNAIKSRAIQSLTDLATPQELFPLYQKEDNKDLRAQWVSVFGQMGAVDQLLQIVKTEKEPSVKNRAVRALGNVKAEKTGTALVDVYTTGDKDTRQAVIQAFANQNNPEGLIAVFDKETDPGLKRDIVSKVAEMAKTSKPAMDFLMKIINR